MKGCNLVKHGDVALKNCQEECYYMFRCPNEIGLFKQTNLYVCKIMKACNLVKHGDVAL